MNEKILADDIPCGLRGWSRLRVRLPLLLLIGLLTTPSSSETQIYGSFSHCHLLPTWTKPPVTGVARKNRKVDLYPNDLAPSRSDSSPDLSCTSFHDGPDICNRRDNFCGEHTSVWLGCFPPSVIIRAARRHGAIPAGVFLLSNHKMLRLENLHEFRTVLQVMVALQWTLVWDETPL